MTETRLQVQHIQAISFDFDDTLWPVEPVIHRAERVLKQWFEAHAPAVLERYDDAGLHAVRQRVGEANPELMHDMTALRARLPAGALPVVVLALPADPALLPAHPALHRLPAAQRAISPWAI